MTAMDRQAQAEALKELKRLKTPMLNKYAECDLAERGNSWNGKQARKARQS